MKIKNIEHLDDLRAMYQKGLTRDDAINALAGKASIYWIRVHWYALRREAPAPIPSALIYSHMDVQPKSG